MDEAKVTINELAAKMVQELRRIGYSEESIYRNYYPRIRTVVKYYEAAEVPFYSVAATNQYIKYQEERLLHREVTDTFVRSIRNIGKRMNEFYITGRLRIPANKRGTVYEIDPENENLIDRFVLDKNYKENTCDDVRWVVRKYLYYLEQKGHASLADVNIEEVRNFILEIAMEVKVSSLHNILLYLKYFHVFLKKENIAAPDCVDLFSYKVYRNMPIQSYVTDEEFDRIISMIDRTSVMGKRDYAIIQLAATTGLRACDIIRLRLTDIDWRRGEIRIIQAKTGRSVALPILAETADALQDYILHGRPSSTEDAVFLRVLPPFYAISNATCIGDMFKRYQRKAGLKRQALDGKGFHGLRRRLAKKLLVSGIPTTAIAQILGHDDIQSVRQYLYLNTENLRECALDFAGIEIETEDVITNESVLLKNG